MNISRLKRICTLIFLLLFICFCNRPTDFARTNEFDPGNISYVPPGPDTVIVDFYSEELLEITVIDQSYTQQKYVLKRKINDGNFETVKEFKITEPKDSVVFIDKASIYGNYTYQITGIYPDRSIQSAPSKPLIAKNWLKVKTRNYKSGDLVAVNQTKVMAFSGNGIEIYSHDTHNWYEVDASFCQRKLSEVVKLKNGNIAVLCTSGELAENKIGVFIFNVKEETWSLAGKLNKTVENFYPDSMKLAVIALSNDKLLIIGFSNWIDGYSIISELFDLKTKSITSFELDPTSYNTYLFIHDSFPDPTGIELSNGKVLVICNLQTDYGGYKNLIYNPAENSWELTSKVNMEIADIALLNDRRVISFIGGGGGFSSSIYDPISDSWIYRGYSTSRSIYSGELVKLLNGLVLTIDSGGNVYLFDIKTNSWIRLQSSSEPGTNFQYSSATVFRENTIMITNAYYKSNYIFRPSPEEEHYFK